MNVLVLGGARQCQEGLKEISQKIVLFTKKSAYAFNSYIAKADLEFPYHGVHLFADDATSEEYVSLALYLHERNPFNAVSCFHDGYQEIAIKIAEKLAIELKLNLDTLHNVMNKDKTRAVLKAAGLDSTGFLLCESKEDVFLKASQLDFPLIMKPHNATASAGVSVIKNFADISVAVDYFEQTKNKYPALLEQFHEGPEFSVEGFSENGEHKILAITRKYVHQDSKVEIGHVVPAPLDTNDELRIETYVIDVIKALGINDGPTHTEIILSSDGPKFIETHTRGGGDYIWDLVRLSTGVDLSSITARQSIGESVLNIIKDTNTVKKHAAIWFLFPEEGFEGRLNDITNIREAEKLEGVYDVSIFKDRGERVGPVQNSFDRLAKVIAVSDDPEKSLNIAKAGIALLKVKLETEF